MVAGVPGGEAGAAAAQRQAGFQAQVKKLASMPSREQMLAELGAGLMSPMAAFVGAMNGLMYMMVGALEALKAQKEGASS